MVGKSQSCMSLNKIGKEKKIPEGTFLTPLLSKSRSTWSLNNNVGSKEKVKETGIREHS